ncbi:MAG: hypothetical protein AAB354_10820 [candidate division KSB1 bacterium]
MKEKLEQRLKELKAEYESGQRIMADLMAKQASLRETLFRISGAIQVLEEELAQENGATRPRLDTENELAAVIQ